MAPEWAGWRERSAYVALCPT